MVLDKNEVSSDVKVKKYRWLIFVIWFFVLVPLAGSAILFYRIADSKMGFMPSFEELENPKSNLASEIYTSDQKLLGKFFIENRTFVNFDELSLILIIKL